MAQVDLGAEIRKRKEKITVLKNEIKAIEGTIAIINGEPAPATPPTDESADGQEDA